MRSFIPSDDPNENAIKMASILSDIAREKKVDWLLVNLDGCVGGQKTLKIQATLKEDYEKIQITDHKNDIKCLVCNIPLRLASVKHSGHEIHWQYWCPKCKSEYRLNTSDKEKKNG